MSKHALYPFYKPYDSVKGKNAYVSGPMTGIGDNNGPAFDAAAETLRALGYAVCNPNQTDGILGPLSFENYMRFDYDRVLEADFLIALPMWERSRGALAELHCAIRIGTPCWGWENWLDYDRIREERINAAISDLYSGKTISYAKEVHQRLAEQALDEEGVGDTQPEAINVGTHDPLLNCGSFTPYRESYDSMVWKSAERVGLESEC